MGEGFDLYTNRVRRYYYFLNCARTMEDFYFYGLPPSYSLFRLQFLNEIICTYQFSTIAFCLVDFIKSPFE